MQRFFVPLIPNVFSESVLILVYATARLRGAHLDFAIEYAFSDFPEIYKIDRYVYEPEMYRFGMTSA